MDIYFDVQKIRTIEFGIGTDEGDSQSYYFVPIERKVQEALKEMIEATMQAMTELAVDPIRYEPSEKHGGCEHVYIPIEDELAREMKILHEANNLTVNTSALSDPSNIFCYFARFSDSKGQRLTAVRRATQFKGILKTRLVQLVSDALKIVEDTVFKLDVDFDFLIDDRNIHILRPSSFESVGKLKDAILSAVPQNISKIQKDLNFVEFANISDYANSHSRAARYLASIRASGESRNIDSPSLVDHCKHTGVEVQLVNGKIQVEEGHIMGFLEVLDRRRFRIELVSGSPERYKAASREKLTD